MGILSNKQGFVYPQTPDGKASLLDLMTEPSHRIAGNSLIIAFEADPDVVRRYVPEPLELDGSGLIYLRTFDAIVYTDRQQVENISEERLSFCENFFWIPCTYDGKPYHYLLFSWVNRDWLAYLGRTAGQPHKVADVRMTRFHPSDRTYNGPGPGRRVSVSVDCVGPVLRAHVDLERKWEMDETPLPYGSGLDAPRYLGRRFMWDITKDRPLVDDLVAHWGDSIEMESWWGGPASVEFFASENEEVIPFQPVRVLGGWWSTLYFDHKSSTPEVVYDYLAER
jgi:acetoacetate decarboxylase